MPKTKKRKKQLASDPERDLLVAYTCRFGPLGAISLREFEATLCELDDDDANMLRYAWGCILDLGGMDPPSEAKFLKRIVERLRDELLDRKVESMIPQV